MTNTNNNMGSPYKALYINVGESFLQWLTCEATRRSHQLFVGKWCLRKEGRNSILMACHCSGQGSASDWLKHISLVARAISIKSTALIWDRSSLWNFCCCSSDAILRANRLGGGGGGGGRLCVLSHSGCLWQNAIIFSREDVVYGCTRKNKKNIYLICTFLIRFIYSIRIIQVFSFVLFVF